jgi:ANTAR domain
MPLESAPSNGRRALTERAKGILMERHSVDEATAFEVLRDHSRAANRKLTATRDVRPRFRTSS